MDVFLLLTAVEDVILSNISARLMLNVRHVLSENAFIEMVVWICPRQSPEVITALSTASRSLSMVFVFCAMTKIYPRGSGHAKYLTLQMKYLKKGFETVLNDRFCSKTGLLRKLTENGSC